MKYNILNIENQNLIVKKAKEKKDGLYTLRGIVYRVNNFGVTHFAVNGEILQSFGAFNCQVGSYEKGIGGESNARKKLKNLN